MTRGLWVTKTERLFEHWKTTLDEEAKQVLWCHLGLVSHSLLFPRCAAVVHHGGTGTVAAALWSARPQIIVPFIFDQPAWAETISALFLGVGLGKLSEMNLPITAAPESNPASRKKRRLSESLVPPQEPLFVESLEAAIVRCVSSAEISEQVGKTSQSLLPTRSHAIQHILSHVSQLLNPS